jgi:hypothetical protein
VHALPGGRVIQANLLAPEEVRVAQLVASVKYECPECYWASREAGAEDGQIWPTKERWLADVERKCRGCGRLTYWCSGGPFHKEGRPATRKDLDN